MKKHALSASQQITVHEVVEQAIAIIDRWESGELLCFAEGFAP